MLFVVLSSCATIPCAAELAIQVGDLKQGGQKCLIPVEFKNNYKEKVKGARAQAFVIDAQGKVIGRSVKWAIGGYEKRPGLEPGKTAKFHFVIEAKRVYSKEELEKLQPRVSVTRIVFADGRTETPRRTAAAKPGGAKPGTKPGGKSK